MKRAGKVAIAVLALVLLALAAGYGTVRSLLRSSLPRYDGAVILPGLESRVTVYRDAFGVPHIYAGNDRDLYRATGYVMAQDRLWQMDLMRRVTTGRLAEILGEDFVDTDLLFRALRIPEKSKSLLESSDRDMIEGLEAFAAGVNAFIKEHGDNLPIEFTILGYRPEPWRPEHSLNLVGYMAWDLTMPWAVETVMLKIRRRVGKERFEEIMPDMAGYESVVYPGLAEPTDEAASLLEGAAAAAALVPPPFEGSNNWAVSGDRSATGMPILANDMHLSLFAPGIWYPIHQSVTGGLDVTGVALPGAPAVVAGHNSRIAWGMTNVMVDDMDFYLEKIKDGRYLYRGVWHPLTVKKETIRIKGGRSVVKEVAFTNHGPVVSGFKKVHGPALSMRWVGNEPSNELRSVVLLNRAESWDDFTDALSTFLAVSQNVVYADRDGNIGLACAAGIPLRTASGGSGPLPGWTGEHEWLGLMPASERPFLFNPESGTVSSANNRTVDDAFGHPVSAWFDLPYRIDRIREMLGSGKKLSKKDFMAMQNDWKSRLVTELLPGILEVLQQAEGLAPHEARALALLEAWDGVLDPDSGAASVFEVMLTRLIRNIFEDEMGRELFREYMGVRLLSNHALRQLWKNRSSVWFDDVGTPGRKESFEDVVLGSFRESAAWLSGRAGPDPGLWKWGAVHRLTLKHPLGKVRILDMIFNLNRGPFPVGGSFHTVSPYAYSLKDPFDAVHGASQRHIYDLADWDASLTVIPTGISGHPASPHYCDQTEMYLEGRYHADLFSRAAVEKAARHVLVLKGH